MKHSPAFAVGVASLSRLRQVAKRLADKSTTLPRVVEQVNEAYGIPPTTTPCAGMVPCLSQILDALRDVGLVWTPAGKASGVYAPPKP
jgi:hypothetical protein